MLAGLASLSYLISLILYWVSGGSKPLDYVGFFLIGSVLLALHFFLGWEYRPWVRRQP